MHWFCYWCIFQELAANDGVYRLRVGRVSTDESSVNYLYSFVKAVSSLWKKLLKLQWHIKISCSIWFIWSKHVNKYQEFMVLKILSILHRTFVNSLLDRVIILSDFWYYSGNLATSNAVMLPYLDAHRISLLLLLLWNILMFCNGCFVIGHWCTVIFCKAWHLYWDPKYRVKTLNSSCYFSSVCAGRVSIIGRNHCTCWSFWKFDRNFCNDNCSLVCWTTSNSWWPTGLQHNCWSAAECYRPNVNHPSF